MDYLTKNRIIEKVLEPLIGIIYDYKLSEAYNYIPMIPNKKIDAWDYYEVQFNSIQCSLDSMIDIDQTTYDYIMQIIIEIKSFVRLYEGINSLPERYFIVNPNLRHFYVAFSIIEQDKDAYDEIKNTSLLKHTPSNIEFVSREQYYYEKNLQNENCNFKYDEDDYTMQELSIAVRRLFQQIL